MENFTWKVQHSPEMELVEETATDFYGRFMDVSFEIIKDPETGQIKQLSFTRERKNTLSGKQSS
ncbi:MAG: hypothetical protein H7Y86_18660 [Rhizobacter sp.]|nr:hypothetical protein [Ferruginibacter sp.]